MNEVKTRAGVLFIYLFALQSSASIYVLYEIKTRTLSSLYLHTLLYMLITTN